MQKRNLSIFIVATVFLIGLPLAGVLLSGEPLAKYTEFPPLTRYVPHAGFSLPVFIALAFVIFAIITPFFFRILLSQASSHPPLTINHQPLTTHHSRFPWWFWFGIALCGTAWVLAWTRFKWFMPFQHFTFSPLWFGYILIINGLKYRKTGHCMLKDRPAYFTLLFPLSAAFWWFFEYLNRFVQNWYYEGVAGLTPLEYFMFATLPFSTVLPAVLGTYELYASNPRAGACLNDFARIHVKSPKTIAWIMLTVSSFGLAGIGIWPDLLFPLLWVSPLLIITSLQTIQGEKNIFSKIRLGDWREIYLLAISALTCGFFWEMWNLLSLAKWKYCIPYVHALHLFEMPLLGYAGYLPFGLECAVIASLFLAKNK